MLLYHGKIEALFQAAARRIETSAAGPTSARASARQRYVNATWRRKNRGPRCGGGISQVKFSKAVQSYFHFDRSKSQRQAKGKVGASALKPDTAGDDLAGLAGNRA